MNRFHIDLFLFHDENYFSIHHSKFLFDLFLFLFLLIGFLIQVDLIYILGEEGIFQISFLCFF
jgi:hypothetical protein